MTDSKQLETAVKPTTATIYEVHFGCDSCHATIIDENGQKTEIEDIAELKNENLTEVKVVNVYDTSKRIPSSTIIVDTPGLSSPDPKHRQTLVDFMPYADGILLVSDVNQQLTRSLLDFIDTISLSQRPIFLVLTKCDTKPQNEIEVVKNYIVKNTKIDLKRIACVSAVKDDLEEFYSLLDYVQKDKEEILKQVNAQRIGNYVKQMLNRIDEMVSATHSDKELEEAVRAKKIELDKMNSSIDGLIDYLSSEIDENEKKIIRKYESLVFEKLDTLVAGKSSNFDAEAVSAINNTTSLLLNEYKESVNDALVKAAREMRNSESKFYFTSLSSIDVSSYTIQGANYNLNLNSLGHEYDGVIATGLTIAAIAGAAYLAAGAAVPAAATEGGVAAGEEGAALAGNVGTTSVATTASSVGVGGALDAADTITDVIFDGGILATQLSEGRATKPNGVADNNGGLSTTEMPNQGGGLVRKLVGLVTDKTMGRPQRRRAIQDYMDGVLLPNFRSEIMSLSRTLVCSIEKALRSDAEKDIDEMTEALKSLQAEMKKGRSAFEERIRQLKIYKNELLNY